MRVKRVQLLVVTLKLLVLAIDYIHVVRVENVHRFIIGVNEVSVMKVKNINRFII